MPTEKAGVTVSGSATRARTAAAALAIAGLAMSGCSSNQTAVIAQTDVASSADPVDAAGTQLQTQCGPGEGAVTMIGEPSEQAFALHGHPRAEGAAREYASKRRGAAGRTLAKARDLSVVSDGSDHPDHVGVLARRSDGTISSIIAVSRRGADSLWLATGDHTCEEATARPPVLTPPPFNGPGKVCTIESTDGHTIPDTYTCTEESPRGSAKK